MTTNWTNQTKSGTTVTVPNTIIGAGFFMFLTYVNTNQLNDWTNQTKN